MEAALQQAINALALGSIYALIALGVAVVFSILGLINFAHGELVTIAGYTLFLLIGMGAPLPVVALAAVFTSVLAAVVLERIAYRPLRGAKPLTLLLTSFAMSLVLQNTFLLFLGARPKGIRFPEWVEARVTVGSVTIQWLDVATVIATVLILVVLSYFLRATVTGLALRSAADDFPTTRLMGIRADRVVLGAFVVSGMLAGFAALLYFAATPAVAPISGFLPLLKGFIAAVIGGLGSLPGAVLGGLLLGGLEIGVEAMLPGALTAYVDALVFAIVVGVLLLRPRGILGSQAVEVRV